MRIQDWFADHFGFQYAVPRVKNPHEKSRYIWFAIEFAKTLAMLALLGIGLFVMLIKAFSVKKGQTPVALLFAAAALSMLSGIYFCFLI